MAEDSAESMVNFCVGEKSLDRALITSGTLEEETFSACSLLNDSFRSAGIVRCDETIWRAHDGGVTSEVEERGEWNAV
jgi:hypothetical protein